MSLGDDFISATELKAQLNIGDSVDDTEIGLAITTATNWIIQYCQRDFNVADSVSARVFYPHNSWVLPVDDMSTTTGLIVKTDTSDNGTFDTTWSATDYQVEPLDGVTGGLTGWPYTTIRAVENRCWPTTGARAPAQITAKWGWAAVPSAVKTACTIQAGRLFKRRYSPEGVLGGFDFGTVRVGTRLDPDVAATLAPYRRRPVAVV